MNRKNQNVERGKRSAFFHVPPAGIRIPVSSVGPACIPGRGLLLAVMFCLIFGLPVRGSRCQDGATAAQIGKWIEQLSDEQFLVRDQARFNLREAGATAYDQLYQARETKDLEARLTIRELLSVIQVHWIRESDTPAVVNMMLGFQQRKPEETTKQEPRTGCQLEKLGCRVLH